MSFIFIKYRTRCYGCLTNLNQSCAAESRAHRPDLPAATCCLTHLNQRCAAVPRTHRPDLPAATCCLTLLLT